MLAPVVIVQLSLPVLTPTSEPTLIAFIDSLPSVLSCTPLQRESAPQTVGSHAAALRRRHCERGKYYTLSYTLYYTLYYILRAPGPRAPGSILYSVIYSILYSVLLPPRAKRGAKKTITMVRIPIIDLDDIDSTIDSLIDSIIDSTS